MCKYEVQCPGRAGRCSGGAADCGGLTSLCHCHSIASIASIVTPVPDTDWYLSLHDELSSLYCTGCPVKLFTPDFKSNLLKIDLEIAEIS